MPLDFARHFFPRELVLVSAALRAASGKPEDATGRLLHVWWITILVFFTLASGQRSIYLLPAAPAIAPRGARARGGRRRGAHPAFASRRAGRRPPPSGAGAAGRRGAPRPVDRGRGAGGAPAPGAARVPGRIRGSDGGARAGGCPALRRPRPRAVR